MNQHQIPANGSEMTGSRVLRHQKEAVFVEILSLRIYRHLIIKKYSRVFNQSKKV